MVHHKQLYKFYTSYINYVIHLSVTFFFANNDRMHNTKRDKTKTYQTTVTTKQDKNKTRLQKTKTETKQTQTLDRHININMKYWSNCHFGSIDKLVWLFLRYWKKSHNCQKKAFCCYLSQMMSFKLYWDWILILCWTYPLKCLKGFAYKSHSPDIDVTIIDLISAQ